MSIIVNRVSSATAALLKLPSSLTQTKISSF